MRASTILPLGALALALAACAAPPGPDVGSCADHFRLYDRLSRFSSSLPDGRDDWTGPPDTLTLVNRLRQDDCLTFSSDIAGMEAVESAAITPVGSAISPATLHLGVVTSGQDDARTQAFFGSKGVRTRSVGAPLLGRRVYAGPFGTQGELKSARTLAVRAGFASPYVVEN